MTDELKPAVGRPTKYDPAYCEAVIEDAAKGFSLSAFCGGILVARDTLTGWREQHPEFDQACKVAKLVRARFLETGIMDMSVPAPAMNARKFALVNCAEEDWREPKQILEHTGTDGGPIQTVGWVAKADDDLLMRIAALKSEEK
jgi:hypothetical protein